MVQNVFDTHSFLFTLQENNENIENYVIEYINSSNIIENVSIKKLQVGASPLSCKVTTTEDEEKTLKYLRVRKVFNREGELIWDNSEKNLDDIKVIRGY